MEVFKFSFGDDDEEDASTTTAVSQPPSAPDYLPAKLLPISTCKFPLELRTDDDEYFPLGLRVDKVTINDFIFRKAIVDGVVMSRVDVMFEYSYMQYMYLYIVPYSAQVDDEEAVTSSDEKQQKAKLADIIQTSDLQAKVYEGGLKLWECAIDIIQYLNSARNARHSKDNVDISWQDKRVLELGCGHGLPGIYMLCTGAKHVTFQDLNQEVLTHLTMTNVILNIKGSNFETIGQDNYTFCSGDWNDPVTSNLLQTASYDIIVTSDTLYSLDSMQPLLNTIKSCLNPSKSSVCIVAAKKYYFGIGGSVTHFVECVEKDGTMKAKIIKKIEDKTSNIREIILLQWK